MEWGPQARVRAHHRPFFFAVLARQFRQRFLEVLDFLFDCFFFSFRPFSHLMEKGDVKVHDDRAFICVSRQRGRGRTKPFWNKITHLYPLSIAITSDSERKKRRT